MSKENDSPEGLTGPVVRGGKWLFLSQATVYPMMLVRSFLLIRLLEPEDWGLWAAIFTTLQLLKNLSEAGINLVAVQHRKGDSPEVLMTAWWINGVRGVVLGGILLAVAPLVAGWFDAPRLVGPLRVISLVFLMEGFVSAGVITASRELAFKRLVLVQQGSLLISIVAAIVLGAVFRNVLALVAAEMLRATLLLVLSYVLLPVKPSLAASVQSIRSLWSRGWHLYFAQLFEFLQLRGAVFVVGPLMGTPKLGLFHLGLNFGMMPSVFIASVVNRVIFPAFAKLRDDAERLGRALLAVERFVVAVAAPACLGIVALAPAAAAFGGHVKYGGMVLPMQMVALGVYVTCLIGINVSVLLGLGHFDVIRKLKLFHLVLVAVAVYPLTRLFGINGAASLSFLQVPVWFAVVRLIGRRIGCGLREQLRGQRFVVVPAAAMTLTIGVLWHLLRSNMVAYTAAAVVLLPTVYLAVLWRTAPDALRELLRVFRQALDRRGETGFAGTP